MPIKSETELTYVVSRGKQVLRVYKKNLMIVQKDLPNLTLQKMQYVADCLDVNLDACIDLMKEQLHIDLTNLAMCNTNAMSAYKNGLKLEEQL